MTDDQAGVLVSRQVWDDAVAAVASASQAARWARRVLAVVAAVAALLVGLLFSDTVSERGAAGLGALVAATVAWYLADQTVRTRVVRRAVAGLRAHLVPDLIPDASPDDLAVLAATKASWVGPRYVIAELDGDWVSVTSPPDATPEDYPGYPWHVAGGSGGP